MQTKTFVSKGVRKYMVDGKFASKEKYQKAKGGSHAPKKNPKKAPSKKSSSKKPKKNPQHAKPTPAAKSKGSQGKKGKKGWSGGYLVRRNPGVVADYLVPALAAIGSIVGVFLMNGLAQEYVIGTPGKSGLLKGSTATTKPKYYDALPIVLSGSVFFGAPYVTKNRSAVLFMRIGSFLAAAFAGWKKFVKPMLEDATGATTKSLGQKVVDYLELSDYETSRASMIDGPIEPRRLTEVAGTVEPPQQTVAAPEPVVAQVLRQIPEPGRGRSRSRYITN